MRRKMKNQKGFTLVEVMIAMIILAIGVLGLAPMMVTSMWGNEFSREFTDVSYIVQDRIEQLKNQSSITPIPFNETTNGINGVYTRTVNVIDNTVNGSIPNGVYQITVTVSWNDKKGLSHSQSYLTYKAK